VVDILLDYVTKTNDRREKILDFHHPGQMKESLDLQIPDKPLNLDQLLVDCKDTLKYGVKTGHPRFFNQLSTGLDIVSLAGEWLTATANTNMFTYETLSDASIRPVCTCSRHIGTARMAGMIFHPSPLAKAIESRDAENAKIETYAADISRTEAEVAQLKSEIEVLSEQIADLYKALKEATELREAEKAENMKTIAEAEEGLAATKMALTILS